MIGACGLNDLEVTVLDVFGPVVKGGGFFGPAPVALMLAEPVGRFPVLADLFSIGPELLATVLMGWELVVPVVVFPELVARRLRS